MKKYAYYFLAPFFFLVATHLHAGTMGEAVSAYSPVVTLSVGPAWSEGGQAGSLQTLQLQPDIQKTYTFNGGWQAVGYGELFLGVEHAITDAWSGQLGLSGALASSSTVEGSVWEDADPIFNNFNYQYDIRHTRLAIKGLLLGHLHYVAEPYIGGSFGVGFNRARRFSLTPALFEELPAPVFANDSHNAFSYALEIGLQKEMVEHWRGGIGYLFQDWGKSYLGRAPGQTLGQGLSLRHLFSQGITFSLSYVA